MKLILIAAVLAGLALTSAAATLPSLSADAQAERADLAAEMRAADQKLLNEAQAAPVPALARQLVQAEKDEKALLDKMGHDTAPANVRLREALTIQLRLLVAANAPHKPAPAPVPSPAPSKADSRSDDAQAARATQASSMYDTDQKLLIAAQTTTSAQIPALALRFAQEIKDEQAFLPTMSRDTAPKNVGLRAALAGSLPALIAMNARLTAAPSEVEAARAAQANKLIRDDLNILAMAREGMATKDQVSQAAGVTEGFLGTITQDNSPGMPSLRSQLFIQLQDLWRIVPEKQAIQLQADGLRISNVRTQQQVVSDLEKSYPASPADKKPAAFKALQDAYTKSDEMTQNLTAYIATRPTKFPDDMKSIAAAQAQLKASLPAAP